MSKFQQRHYEAIAQRFQWMRAHENDTLAPEEEAYYGGILKAQETLASLFAEDNYLFDREHFGRACVPGANVKARTR